VNEHRISTRTIKGGLPSYRNLCGTRDIAAYVAFFLAAYMVFSDNVIVRRLFLPEIFAGKVGAKKFKGEKVAGLNCSYIHGNIRVGGETNEICGGSGIQTGCGALSQ